MKASFWIVLLVLSVSLVFAGCKGEDQKTSGAKQYPIKGKVVAVDPSKPSVKLDHEDIPGLMKGMEMSFDVENPKVLEGLQPGEVVQGRLKVESGKYVITHLEKR
jgi:Cu/Ag efflux protein CusF